MKPEAVLVNVGRGRVVDEDALEEALRHGRLLGAACDVFTSEPPGCRSLLQLDNFVGTPHVGAQTVEAQRKVGWDVVRIIEAFVAGEQIAVV